MVDSTGTGMGSIIIILSVTDVNGCYGSDTVIISFTEYPDVVITGPDTMDYKQDATYEASPGYHSYLWSTGHTTHSVTLDSTDLNSGDNTIYVTVTSEYGCQSIAEKSIYADPSVGLTEEYKQMQISVYPNPNKGIFTLEIKGVDQKAALRIFNVSGQLITEEMIQTRNYIKSYDLTNLDAGVYYIQIHNQDMVKTRKLIIH